MSTHKSIPPPITDDAGSLLGSILQDGKRNDSAWYFGSSETTTPVTGLGGFDVARLAIEAVQARPPHSHHTAVFLRVLAYVKRDQWAKGFSHQIS